MVRTGVLAAFACAASIPTVAAPPVTTIRIAAHYNSQQIRPLQACFRQYEAQHPGIRIDYQQVSYQDFFQTVMVARAGKSPVDIYNLYSIWAPQLIGTHALDAPPADIDRFVRANYTPATIGAATISGRLWGIPTGVSIYQLVYNKKLFAAAGLSAPPRTPAEMTAMAAAITKKNRQGNILTAGYATDLSGAMITHAFYAELYAAGARPYTADMRHTNLRSPAAVAVLTRQVDLFKRGISSYSVQSVDFAGGSVGMAIMANWMKDTLQASLGPRFSETVGVAPIPSDGPGGTMLYAFFWGVDAASTHKRASWDLLRWLNSPRANGAMSCTATMLSGMGDLTGNRTDMAAMRAAIADPFSQQFVKALDSPGAVSQPNLWHADEVDRQLKFEIQQALSGRLTPAAALAAADQDITAILAEQP
ncbi:ABC transporter substrate-binding protein [Novosphingobium sp.]|uniref:ABC transporter substrate-binding protein n=1 Tax=Novosphingobium sp. TaxID=1874826 RepID=UPI003B51F71C